MQRFRIRKTVAIKGVTSDTLPLCLRYEMEIMIVVIDLWKLNELTYEKCLE